MNSLLLLLAYPTRCRFAVVPKDVLFQAVFVFQPFVQWNNFRLVDLQLSFLHRLLSLTIFHTVHTALSAKCSCENWCSDFRKICPIWKASRTVHICANVRYDGRGWCGSSERKRSRILFRICDTRIFCLRLWCGWLRCATKKFVKIFTTKKKNRRKRTFHVRSQQVTFGEGFFTNVALKLSLVFWRMNVPYVVPQTDLVGETFLTKRTPEMIRSIRRVLNSRSVMSFTHLNDSGSSCHTQCCTALYILKNFRSQQYK